MSCCSVREAAYFLISCTFARVSGSASVIREQIWYLSWESVKTLSSLGLTKRPYGWATSCWTAVRTVKDWYLVCLLLHHAIIFINLYYGLIPPDNSCSVGQVWGILSSGPRLGAGRGEAVWLSVSPPGVLVMRSLRPASSEQLLPLWRRQIGWQIL